MILRPIPLKKIAATLILQRFNGLLSTQVIRQMNEISDSVEQT